VAVSVLVAVLVSALWAVLPPSGSDLAAQVAHADFFGSDGWLPVDMGWFGGTDVYGYSVISPPLMALIGVTAFGIVTTVAASGLLALLLRRSAVPRPRVAGLVGALIFGANLMVGRLTFALGICVGLATLLCLWVEGRRRVPLLVIGMIVTWAASPLAALFLMMVGVALVARRRVADGSILGMTGGLMLLASAVLGQSGVMPMELGDVVRGVVACALVASVTRYQLVRIVAGLSALSLVCAYAVATPVGVNALRLPAIFAVPVALATSRLRWRALIPLVAATLLLIPPMTLGDAVVGQPATQVAYFTPLDRQLEARQLTGRVEVVPTADRWEAVYVAGQVPLARGWMTQIDRANNALFFDSALMTPRRYQRWLQRNAVQYVAVSTAAPAAAGASEKALIAGGLPYLARVWHSTNWTLYAVRHHTTTVSGAVLLSQDARGVSFRSVAPGSVTVRVHWSRWLDLQGPRGCLQAEGRWTRVRVRTPGDYLLSSALLPQADHVTCGAG
jgi:hypothetical protein